MFTRTEGLVCFALLACTVSISAQPIAWTWMKGAQATNTGGVWDGRPTPALATNILGGRAFVSMWASNDGKLHFFSGAGLGAEYPVISPQDLWTYDVSTGVWTWAGGYNGTTGGVYGAMGAASTSNLPGGRYGAHDWMDASGDLWLFGGCGAAASSAGILNDMWKYSLTNGMWTWVKGPNTPDDPGSFGTMGYTSGSNNPPSRMEGCTWIDAAGNLWLFGGRNLASDQMRNDLWKFDVSSQNWTWMKGSSGTNQWGTYGTKGIAASGNVPGSRYGATAWTDANGDLWLFGGIGYPASPMQYMYLNDLWKYNIATGNWTWVSGDASLNQTTLTGVYGTLGVPNAGNNPPSKYQATGWTDANGNLLLFAGWQQNGFNDLWQYSTSTGYWTWIKGPNQPNQNGNYGMQGVAAATNIPSPRGMCRAVKDVIGNVWLYGGKWYGYGTPINKEGYWGDLWKYTMADGNFTWVAGADTLDPLTSYGPPQAAELASSTPQADASSSAAAVYSNNHLWLLQGGNYGTALWKYNIASGNWLWVDGQHSHASCGEYGTQGVSDLYSRPGYRQAACMWTDGSGNIWVFGGHGRKSYVVASSQMIGRLNDTWKFDLVANRWTWMKGSNFVNQTGTYGTIKSEHPLNNPGARMGAMYWSDVAGNFWMFGGDGYGASGMTTGLLNDFWRFCPSTGNWTWIAGDYSINMPGSYGIKGVPDALNNPPARTAACTWTDAGGNLWMYGGSGTSGSRLTDLWKFDVGLLQWVWVSGSQAVNQDPVYGTKGIPSASNSPGSRTNSSSWVDVARGVLWLSGGTLGQSGFTRNDVWTYAISSGLWTWVGGTSGSSPNTIWGTLGVASTANTPGGRHQAVSWTDGTGQRWLFGGQTAAGLMGELWKMTGGESLQLDAKVYLAGPWNSLNGTMNTLINTVDQSWLPTAQPYGASPFSYTGAESVSSNFFNSNRSIVDWVLVELRSGAPPTMISVARRAAFLKSDGSIVDIDGVSPVSFADVLPGYYSIVVFHRNHLAIMSASAVAMSSVSVTTYDFTTAANQAYSTSPSIVPQKLLATGKYGLYSGDGNADGGINSGDQNSVWRAQFGNPGYLNGDFNLDGSVNAGDINSYWRPNNGIGTQVPKL
jgi:hypothetical protein